MADYIGFRLTGEAVMEAGQAARTMAYDVVKASWSEQILNACGLEPGFLPPVRVATTPLGGVSKEAAKLTGLAEAMPVFVGGHDHFCAAFASGALSPDIAMDSYGTAEAFTLGFKGKPDPAKAGAFAVGPHVLPGYSYLLGGIYSSGGAVAWLRDLLKLEYQTLPKLAATVRPGDAPLFIAEFHGAAPPFNVPKASGVFIELIPEHSQAHLARAIYEGIAFELKMNIEGLEQVTRQTIECIRMVGGAGSLPLWSKIRASIYQRPIEIAAHDDMVTLGVALLAGLGAGIYQNPAEAIRQTFRIQKVIQPDPAWQASYEQPYTRYKRYIQALRVVQED
jgi:xylulokinase